MKLLHHHARSNAQVRPQNTMQIVRHIFALLVAMVIVIYLINQCRKPHGWLGRFFLWEMGGRHSSLTVWGLSLVSIERHYTTLDVGCGGGRTVSRLAGKATEGKVFGVDYSAASVAASRRTNKELINAGRVEIHRASVSNLPFADGTFDLITAVETHYYWPDLVADLKEVLRVLKPGGKFIIMAEAYKRRSIDPTQAAMKLLRAAFLTADEHRELLTAAGYSDVQIIEERKKGWICAIGRRSF